MPLWRAYNVHDTVPIPTVFAFSHPYFLVGHKIEIFTPYSDLFLFSLQQWLDPNKRVLQQLKGIRHVFKFSTLLLLDFLFIFLFSILYVFYRSFHLSLVLSICRDVRGNKKNERNVALRCELSLSRRKYWADYLSRSSARNRFFSPPCCCLQICFFLYEVLRSTCSHSSFLFVLTIRNRLTNLVLCRQILRRRPVQTRRGTDQVHRTFLTWLSYL